ncbi:putative EMP1-like protein, partial [Plasmodium gaboni]
DRDTFKEYLLHDAYNEGKQLWNLYSSDEQKALDAMKYSFADYGDIVKGDDMMNDLDRVQKQLSSIFKQNGSVTGTESDNRKQWWEKNKQKVWNVMMCHYNGKEKTDTECPKHDDIDDDPQFLRWLTEWAQLFCYEKVDEAKTIVKQCIEKDKIQKATKISEIGDKKCQQLLKKYKHWYKSRNQQWEGLKDAYKNYKTNNVSSGSGKLPSEADAEKYLKKKCPKCDCNYDDLQKISKYQNQQEQLLKELTKQAKYDTIDPKNTPLYKFLTLGGLAPTIIENAFKTTAGIIDKGIEYGPQAVDIAKDVLKKL